jgi:hypothetical protein
MIRRLNYTGRRKFPRENIRVTLFRNGGLEEFVAVIKTAGLQLPDSARIFVEAYHKSDWMRFDFGSVAVPAVPADRRLTVFYEGARVLFRVKVVSADTAGEPGKIIAETDRIIPVSPDDERDHDPLLPVRLVGGLGDEVWRLSWQNGPVLELNKNEPEIKHFLTADNRFKWLILPNVLRAVLIRILIDAADEEPEQDESAPGNRWMEFAQSLHAEPPPKPADRDTALINEWVDEVVSAFCRHHRALDTWRISLRPQADGLFPNQ